jgi:DNA-binding MurR/RpiR family transcriptional regulator
MSTRLTLAIQEHFEKLSPSERRLATLLVDRADDLLAYSASEMAAMAGVSKATAARLFRSLGYADFNEVKLQARQERNLAPPFQREVESLPPPPRGAPTLAQHLHAEVDSLTRTFETLRGDTLREAAALVAGAPRLWLLGFGLDEGLVRFLRPQLARVRPEVFLLEAPGGLWAESLALTSARDCLLLVQTQPRVALLDAVLTHAAASRMPIVAVVDIRNVAWARRSAQSVLPVIGASAEHAYSAMAGASMLHLLVQHVAERLGERARQRQAGVQAIRREMDEGP